MGAFIHPFTDWGFKHIFGREESKDILIEFLNDSEASRKRKGMEQQPDSCLWHLLH